jgi:amino acid transporter
MRWLDLVLITLAVAIEPIPLSILILVLSGPESHRRGNWFLGGWVLCVLAVILIGLALGHSVHSATPHKSDSLFDWGKLVGGIALIGYSFWVLRRHVDPNKQPSWMRGIDHLRGPVLAGLAAFLSPQLVVFAGVMVIVQLRLGAVPEGALALAFLVLSCLPYVVLVGIATFRPESSRQQLDRLREFIDRNHQQVFFVILLAIGLYLSARAIWSLSS